MRPGACAILLLAALALAPARAAAGEERAPAPPAQVAGLWCGTGPLHEFSIEIAQNAAAIEGRIRRKQRERHVIGRVEGNTVITDNTKVGGLVLEAVGDQLQVTGGNGPIALLRGQAFARARGDSCTG